MGKKKVLLAITFVAIAMASGGMVSIFEMNKGSMEVKATGQTEIEDTTQAELEDTTQAELESAVQADKMMFSCEVLGCTQTGVHKHGLC